MINNKNKDIGNSDSLPKYKLIKNIKSGIIIVISFIISFILSILLLEIVSIVLRFFGLTDISNYFLLPLFVFIFVSLKGKISSIFIINNGDKNIVGKKNILYFIILFLINIIIIIFTLFNNNHKNSPGYLYSAECPEGQIVAEWERLDGGKIKVISCIIPYVCNKPGETLRESCGFFSSDRNKCTLSCQHEPIAGKPIIYFYPEQKTDIKVKLDFQGKIIADYPKYDNNIKGWNITAYPDGTIIDKKDKKEYSYLFWEGKYNEEINWNFDKGFVVKGSESINFLQEILPKIGLTPKEYNEFIVYWGPNMQKNKYNLIQFAGKQYTDTAKLEIVPKYDSLLRVFMVIKPLDNYKEIEPQIFEKFERKGFTVVEWGGTILD